MIMKRFKEYQFKEVKKAWIDMICFGTGVVKVIIDKDGECRFEHIDVNSEEMKN